MSIRSAPSSPNSLNIIPLCAIFLSMGRKVRVRIESVAFKGYGVARIGGKVVFVPYTLTGDEA
jgi:hypothetical protein